MIAIRRPLLISLLLTALWGALLPVAHADVTPQIIRIGAAGQQYPFPVYANMDLTQAGAGVRRVIILEHGVKRDADHYFEIGMQLMRKADLAPSATLLLAPKFAIAADALAQYDMPLWTGSSWMQGKESSQGRTGITSFQVLDDIAGYLRAGGFPGLQEIVFIGHSAGAQLMQRYAVLNNLDETVRSAGINVRYVISSPSSYLYLDGDRPDGAGFAMVGNILCPGYNNYRYGVEEMPAYGQGHDGKQLFRRYAARNVAYLVGLRDNNPNHRWLDNACGARLQGSNRLERHRNYLRYEQFLAQKWDAPVTRTDIEVKGAGHDASGIFESDAVAAALFPARQNVKQ
ncbi:alpha/beta fold hydrolase [Herbaspirillum autotrophicum]|uniref:alpha/beta fold hydrolase n=1 Tax=Herbaspirillum autotrophicum TaxID=180195 RepID=UPI000B229DCA|nr:alpha/beta fold hydrolase [Herbaspirillum autotrophicum]